MDFSSVLFPNLTFGAVELGHLSRLDPQKPDGFRQIKPENLISKSVLWAEENALQLYRAQSLGDHPLGVNRRLG
jgi:hypothetical protein